MNFHSLFPINIQRCLNLYHLKINYLIYLIVVSQLAITFQRILNLKLIKLF